MPNLRIKLPARTNNILKKIKKENHLRNKSVALEQVVRYFVKNTTDPELLREFRKYNLI